ncbi:GAF domain-containing sensor histidine kinase [Fodinicola acaciae]|uniref:GAF domain-containing sensor histidine kinase n=1 Tax=Fodinicola acaciae TaxID=2681555 RepID=UPI0013D1F6D2|nr:GAF domain-containing sensor histidine kinase [Fodinicola acaciae]
MADPATLQRLLDVALDLQGERRPESVLRTVLKAAKELTDARHAAVGVPDGDGGFALFLVEGVDAKTWGAIGYLPRTHGFLGTMLADPEPFRLRRLSDHPKFTGRWPKAHPKMVSFLGVPVVASGEIVAALYLSNKLGGDEFTDEDMRVVEALAAHAALAVVSAQRQSRLRELSVAAERARLARDLHDSVTQTMFSLTLAAESAASLTKDSDPRLVEQVDRIRALAGTAREELASLLDTLRPAEERRDDLSTLLRRRVELLRRIHDTPIELRLKGEQRRQSAATDYEVGRIATEALSNALKHASAQHIEVTLEFTPTTLRLTVADDGVGFDLARTVRQSRRMGLSSMTERAAALGGDLHVESKPGAGTIVSLEVTRDC